MQNYFYSLLRKFKYSKMLGLHGFINSAYYDPATVILHTKRFDYVSVDGCKFYSSDQLDSLQRVKDNPWFGGIRPTDIAVDIGANIGAVTVPVAKKADRVYAIEPLFYRELEANIRLNALRNVDILPCGLGNGDIVPVEFSSKSGTMQLMSFNQIKQRAGRIDFLKCDCEGYEWGINPEWLKGIRELRFEMHMRRSQNGKDNLRLKEWKIWMLKNGYEVDIDWGESPSICVPFEACAILRASLKGG